MSLDVRITWSAALAAVGNTQPRGAESKQRRRRSSDAAVCSAMSIHAPRRDMVALCVCESTDASDVASARNAGSHGRSGQEWRCRTLQHAQRGVYRKAELRAADRVDVEPGFVATNGSRRSSRQDAHLLPLSTSVFKIKAPSQQQRQTDGWHTGHISWGRQPNVCIEGIDRGLHQAVRLPKRAKPQCITRS